MELETVRKTMQERGIKFVYLKFVDMLGTVKACEVTAPKFVDAVECGRWFDGSSIEGFIRIYESDMLLRPDLATFRELPNSPGVASVMCDIYLDDKTPFEGDPRRVLKLEVAKAKEAGYDYKVGPELEFFLFKTNEEKPIPHDAGGYFDLGPLDLAADVRRDIIMTLESSGMEIEIGHHEVAPGQHEIDFKYGDAISTADNVLSHKMLTKAVAANHGLFASFMPKPIFGVNGSGMHVNQSLWKDGENAFYEPSDPRGLSKVAYSFIAGQLEHAREFAAVVAPTVNSYKRLVPGYEAPTYVCWGMRNRSALIRVPRCIKGRESSTRAELRCPDPSCNPYLAFAAILAAGMDGVKRNLSPSAPMEEDVFEFDDKKLADHHIQTLPGSLGEAASLLEESKLMRETLGERLHSKLVEAQKSQYNEYSMRVTPWELERYLPIL